MENQPPRTLGRPKAPQTIETQSKFIGSGGVRSDRKSQNLSKITFSSLFSHFPPEIGKMEEFHEFWGNLAKRGSLGGPAPRSLFSLRNIKVSEPPESRKLVRNWISWNFMNIHGISRNCVVFRIVTFWRNFTIFGVLERFESSRGA